MNLQISRPVSRALALATLIGLIALIYYGIVRPLADAYASDRAEIARLTEVLTRYQHAAEELPARQAQLAALTQRNASAEGFLEGPNYTLIAAQLQNRIKVLADRTKADLKSSQVLPAEADGKVTRVTVRAQLSASMGGVLEMFHDLETHSPFLFIDNVDLRARPSARRGRDDPSATDIIDVQFDLYGYNKASG